MFLRTPPKSRTSKRKNNKTTLASFAGREWWEYSQEMLAVKKALPMTDYTFKPRGRKWDESSVSPADRRVGVGNLWLTWRIQKTCFPTDVQNSNCLALLLKSRPTTEWYRNRNCWQTCINRAQQLALFQLLSNPYIILRSSPQYMNSH